MRAWRRGKQIIRREHGFLLYACIPCRGGRETVCIIKQEL